MEQKPWLRHYDDGVPATLSPYPEVTLVDVLKETVRQKPRHPVLFFKGSTMSGETIERISDTLADALVGMGVRKGDRVALLLPNCPQSVIGHFGIWKAGAVAVPMNPFYTESEMEQLLGKSQAEIAIVLTPFYSKLKSIQSGTRVRLVVVTGIEEYLPPIQRFLFGLSKRKRESPSFELQLGDVWLKPLLRRYANSRRPAVDVRPRDPALLLFSGGTTGVPKAVIGSHQALVISAMQARAWISGVLKEWDDIFMQVLPLFHPGKRFLTFKGLWRARFLPRKA